MGSLSIPTRLPRLDNPGQYVLNHQNVLEGNKFWAAFLKNFSGNKFVSLKIHNKNPILFLDKDNDNNDKKQ